MMRSAGTLQQNLDHTAIDPRLEFGLRRGRRSVHDVAGLEVEGAAVPRADYTAVLQLTLVQRR